MKKTLILTLIAACLLSSCSSKSKKTVAQEDTKVYEKIDFIKDKPKSELNNNPISAVTFCADPTSVVYEGRLYVYGSNDHAQYEAVGPKGKNTFGKDLFCFRMADKGIIPRGAKQAVSYGIADETLAETCNRNVASGWGCAAWVVYKGNMDYLRKDVSWD